MKLDVLHVDNHLLVVNKRAGLLTQQDKTGDPDILTLAKDFIKAAFHKPGNVYIGLVHRLDRPVSGVIVLARTSKAASRLSAQFREGTAIKKYIALVEGTCRGEGLCEDYIVKDGQKVSIADTTHPQARYARLAWKSLAHRNHLSLLDIRLKTGRPHQIRIQLAHRGFPVLGDVRYGGQKKFDGQNIALHCYVAGIHHPVTRELMVWCAPPPASWRGYFDTTTAALIDTAGGVRAVDV
jgi:RluA family pseudouridine synthase